MYTYHRLIKRTKRRFGILQAMEDIFAFVSPILWTWLFDLEALRTNPKGITFYIAVIWAVLYLGYLVWRVIFTYRISNDKRDVYRKQIMDQVDTAMRDKYKMLCKEIHYASRRDEDVLLYDAQDVINIILSNIKQLVSNITGVSLDNISVNFIYRYYGENEHWQTIDGSSSCSIGTLDTIVEKEPSTYHYLYANNCEYIFYNDKGCADWHTYTPSMRDGKDRKQWGSIYCKRILCTMHQNRIVDGILAVSTYNEKFTTARGRRSIEEIEDLINEAVLAFTSHIKIEMASLYIRHISMMEAQCETIELLRKLLDMKESGASEIKNPHSMTEDERAKELEELMLNVKDKHQLSSAFFENQAWMDSKVRDVLRERINQLYGNCTG